MKILDQISQDEFEKIEAYLHQEMNSEERALFEEELSTNPKLKKAFQEVEELGKNLEEAAFRIKMEEFHKELTFTINKDQNLKKPRNIYKKGMGFAMAIAAILVVLFLWKPGNSYNKIYNNHFFIDPGLPTPMSSGKNYSFNEAMVDYKQKDYRSAIDKWENQLKAKPQNDTLNYFIGVSYLNQNRFDKAKEYLSQSEIYTNSIFREEATFYLALIFLKEKDIEKSIEILENSSSKANRELLEDLKRI